VTVRFETAETPAGPVRSYAADDPQLHPWRPDPEADPGPDPAPDPGPAPGEAPAP
jgi:DNA polymerase IV